MFKPPPLLILPTALDEASPLANTTHSAQAPYRQLLATAFKPPLRQILPTVFKPPPLQILPTALYEASPSANTTHSAL